MNEWVIIVSISLAAFVLNLPFGWLRTRTRRFGVAWFACIHAPIPVVALIRISTHTAWYYIPVFFAVSILGQVAGSRINTAS